MTDIKEITDRYVAVWNEPDPDLRRKLIEQVWAPTGSQILTDPPQAVRDAAADLRFAVPSLEVHGYDALEARVTRAYEMFVGTGEFVFRPRDGGSELLRNLVAVAWEMVSTKDGAHAGGGVDVLDLDGSGRIRTDYQFIER